MGSVDPIQPADVSPIAEAEAPRDCPLCPRLVRFREECRSEFPDWWNAPVPAFGDRHAWLAIVGLAPGKHGANRTGRPFTGDFAGELLYGTLLKFGLAEGEYRADPGDGLRLNGAIMVVERLGANSFAYLQLADRTAVTVELDGMSDVVPGAMLEIVLPSDAVHVFDRTGRAV